VSAIRTRIPRFTRSRRSAGAPGRSSRAPRRAPRAPRRSPRLTTALASVTAAAAAAAAALLMVPGGGAAPLSRTAGLGRAAAGATIRLDSAAAPAGPAGPAAPAGLAAAALAAQQRANRHTAQQMLGHYGWGARQFTPLNKLWTRESGWNKYASNPYSGAYGIPQAVPGGKMSSAGPHWRTNATTQIRWGLRYIKSRYGSPTRAWAHELAYGWY
jgi:hypothetical protein